ncbi:hypothetical protein [Mumia sp. DW29H23]|uniref:hypothetical protein n=1 Tax=Mumia sp. DW29H23 TaxID=3421241 RepID=UPI003D69D437
MHSRERRKQRTSTRGRTSSAIAAVALGGAVLATASMLTAPPASAYKNPSTPEAEVAIGSCKVVSGTLRAFKDGAGCRMNDAYDGTFLRYDAGGRGAKLEVRTGSTLRAKVEFHPYSEQLWVYDTRADKDTVYVTLSYAGNPNPRRVYTASAHPDPYDLSIAEGKRVTVNVYDDAARELDPHGNPALVPYNKLDAVTGTA